MDIEEVQGQRMDKMEDERPDERPDLSKNVM